MLFLPPVLKTDSHAPQDFYEEHPRVTERTEAEVEEWRKERNITIEGKAAKPITSWVEARLPDYICDYIEAKHFVSVSCSATASYRLRESVRLTAFLSRSYSRPRFSAKLSRLPAAEVTLCTSPMSTARHSKNSWHEQ